MKHRKLLTGFLIGLVLAVGSIVIYQKTKHEQNIKTNLLVNDDCKSGPISGRISIGKDSQTSDAAVMNILEKNGGKITEDFSEFSLKYADVPIGSEDKIIKELTALPGVRADYENRGCTS